MLTQALRALYADGGNSPIARRWEFREESPVEGTDRSLFIAMGVIAILSLGSTLGLLSFLTHRFIYWQRYYKRPLAQNQYVVLIFNLLLVDLQQSIAFLISLHWAARGSTHFGETACYLQGWWIQTGDAGSGLFVLSIALHTSAVVLRGRQLPFNTFVYCVIVLWMFILILGFIPVGLYGSKVFVITEANWCWLSPEHQAERLWGHYLWIFLSEFGTVVLYTIMFFYLRRRMAQAKMLRRGQQESLQRLNRVVVYMVIYPLVYLVLSLPLAAGRMATARGNSPSKTYFGVAGCLMASSGLMDVIVYTVTRRHLISDTEHSTTDRIYDYTDSQWQTNITTTNAGEGTRTRKGGLRMGSRLGSKFRRSIPTVDKETRNSPFEDSTDDIVQKDDVEMNNLDGGVYQETTIEITHEPATPADTLEGGSRRSG
ncbi:G protein-coupled receptor GprD [Penicillium brasilianum]|uniref:G protein-coupled receptor GprD n=1 Tax=Penicillium brasilianum TaxID=104259 RepID=A0A1S9RS65_PENBI|nr:G protein-coupled receptor GprD [Penicillium brasilianum]